MIDQKYHQYAGPFRLEDILQHIEKDQQVLNRGELDGALEFDDVASLAEAQQCHVGFFENPKYVDQLNNSQAGCVIVSPKRRKHVPEGMAVIELADAYRGYAMVADLFHPIPTPTTASIHATAVLGTGVVVEDLVVIGPNVVIGSHVMIGRGTVIGANSVIGERVTIGRHCNIGNQVSISHAMIGDRVELLHGVRIGQDGFGFAMGPKGHMKVPQLGRVIVQDDVSIGANSCVDRGAGPDTVIGEGCKIDNLVQIGHNVRLGRHVVVAGMTGIAGSAKLEDFVAIGGHAGVAGHITLGAGTQLAAFSALMHETKPRQRMAGIPAMDARKFFKLQAMIGKFVSGDKNDN